jgi:hypothetical protein
MLAKKDAHPENWLIDADGAVVMLDLEASADRPLIAEVVQLLDDYPLCDVSEEGFTERMGLTDHYLDALATYGIVLSYPSPRRLYELFALQRAVFGLALVPAVERHAKSSAALEVMRTRKEHFAALCQWLTEHAHDAAVRTAARTAAAAIGPQHAVPDGELADLSES